MLSVNEETITIFKKLLVLDNPQISHLTLKNYLSDLRHFINWYSKSLNRPFSPVDINLDIVTLYLKVNGSLIENGNLIPETRLSDSSIKRHLSSLKKFFILLGKENPVFKDPFESIEKKKLKPINEFFKIGEFKEMLLLKNASTLTVKNYMSDILSFARWYEDEKLKGIIPGSENQKPTFLIDQSIVDDYKNYLLEKSAIRSVNRKLSSLRRYLEFCQQSGIINIEKLIISNVSNTNNQQTQNSS